MSAKILVVEDDPAIQEILLLYLRRAGYSVLVSGDGLDAMNTYTRSKPDLIVLDLMLPGQSGFALMQRIRQLDTLPILILTARDGTSEKVHGLRHGADDYMAKPFDPEELLARIEALLRRSGRLREAIVSFDGLCIDPAAHQVTIDQQRVDLAPREFELLYVLACHPNRAFSRQSLLDLIWGTYVEVDERAVDAAIARLRRHLQSAQRSTWSIATVWGLGYKFKSEPS